MADWDPAVNEIFQQAIEAGSASERAAVLDRLCGDDVELRRKVEALLILHDGAGSFLENPAPGLFAARSVTTGLGETLPYVEPGRSSVRIDEKTELFEPSSPASDNPVSRPLTEGPGTRIGPYKLLQQIGEGGMGVVYMAEQEAPVRRKVALKIIKPGMDTGQVIARFEAERQALALMDHPNIARVFDAGATGTGRPFFVMELVNGVPITEFCDGAQLTPRERLELFVAVCRAIQHAHQKGIIHRDVKPSNVLVTLVDGRPMPKVIDFGVAKATGQALTERSLFTQFGAIVGTLEYMSPEQAELSAQDVDTRSDVFSLGVLLYELLTGSTPLERARLREAGYAEILRRIREEEPPRPSTRLSDSGEALPSIAARRQLEPAKLTKLVRGELDWIVMKALEKDRTRRYETASEFAQDVERYLADEAVEACPPSRRYRLRKFARKNRAALATWAAIAAALLIAAIVGGYLAVRATKAEALANRRRLDVEAANAATAEALGATEVALGDSERAREQAEALSKFLVEAFRRPDPSNDGRTLKVVDVLDRAVARLDSDVGLSPAIRGAILSALGETYLGLGLHDRATEVLQKARALLRLSLGPDSRAALETSVTLAGASSSAPYVSPARASELVVLLEETLERITARLGPDDPLAIHCRTNLALAYSKAGREAESIALNEEMLRLGEARLGPDAPEISSLVRNNAAVAYREAGRAADAIPLFERSLKTLEAQFGPDNPKTLRSRSNLAFCYRGAGRLAEAISLGEENLRLARARLGPDHLDTLVFGVNLAEAYEAAGRKDEAIARLEEALKLGAARLGPDEFFFVFTRVKLVEDYAAAGRRDDAIALLEEGVKLDVARRAPSGASFNIQSKLALLYAEAGRHADAIGPFREAIRLGEAAVPRDESTLFALHHRLAHSYRTAGRLAEAIAADEQALKLGAPILGADHPNVIDLRAALADAYHEAGRREDAIAMAHDGVRLGTPRLGPDHPAVLRARLLLATDLAAAGQRDQAISLLEETIKLCEPKLGRDHPSVIIVRNSLAGLFHAAGRLAEALTLQEAAVSVAVAKLGPTHLNTMIARLNLAKAFDEAGRRAEAEVIYRDWLALVRKAPPPGAPELSQILASLGLDLVAQEKWVEAEPIVRECLEIRQASRPDDWKTFNARSLLGASLLGQRRYAEAEPLLVASYEGMKAREATIPPNAKARLADALGRVVRLYEAWGKPEKAEVWRRKTGAIGPPAGPTRR